MSQQAISCEALELTTMDLLIIITCIVFLVVASLLALIVLIPIVFNIVMALFDHWRFDPDYFAPTLCPSCAKPFGADAIQAAKFKRHSEIQKMKCENRGVKFRLDCRTPLTCLSCGANWLLNYRTRTVDESRTRQV